MRITQEAKQGKRNRLETKVFDEQSKQFDAFVSKG
jgi:hypothetical protein